VAADGEGGGGDELADAEALVQAVTGDLERVRAPAPPLQCTRTPSSPLASGMQPSLAIWVGVGFKRRRRPRKREAGKRPRDFLREDKELRAERQSLLGFGRRFALPAQRSPYQIPLTGRPSSPESLTEFYPHVDR
jgi:hypothetical protein